MTPLLVTRDPDNPAIFDSTKILQFLQRKYPKKVGSLYPKEIQQQVEDLEETFDQEVGVPIRRFVYGHVLPYPKLAQKALISPGVSWIERKLMPIMYP